MQILLLEIVLRDRQFGFHLPAGLVGQYLAETALTFREQRLCQVDMFLLELDVDVAFHQSQHPLDNQLFGKIFINPLIQHHLPQPLIDLMSKFLHKFVAGLHAADAMPVVKGRLVSKCGGEYIFSLTRSALARRANSCWIFSFSAL